MQGATLAALDVVFTVLDVAFLAILLLLLQWMTGPPANGGYRKYYNFFLTNSLAVFACLTLFFFIKNVAACFFLKLQNRLLYQVAGRLSEQQMSAYLGSEFANFTSKHSSKHIYRIGQLPIEFAHYVLRGVQQITGQVILIGFTLAALAIYRSDLLLLLLLVFVPPAWLTHSVVRKKIATLRITSRQASENSLKYLTEALGGYVESFVFQQRSFFVNRYSAAQIRLNELLATQQSLQGVSSRMLEVLAVGGMFLLLFLNKNYGAVMPIMTVGAFLAAAYKLIPALAKIMNASALIKAYKHTISELAANQYEQMNLAESLTPVSIQSIDLENICFHYNGKKIVENLSLSLSPGEFIGLSGLSGRGKTTLINLLLGFLEPSEGTIYFNKTPVRQAARLKYQSRISYSQQRPFILNESLRQNITFDKATGDMERYKSVSQISGTDFLDNKSVTVGSVSEDGRNLSGGQRQRIAFARALYKEADLLILDEPFSELDRESEASMTKHLRDLADQGKMILLISHSQGSLVHCSKKINLDAS